MKSETNKHKNATDSGVQNQRVVSCEYCNDGNGGCVYPYYGVAPHSHDLKKTGYIIGSTVIDDASKWPENFSEDSDPDAKGLGFYTHCLHCGAGN